MSLTVSLDDPRGGLARECAILCRLLTGGEPDARIVEAYIRGHAHASLSAEADGLDRLLLSAARRGVTRARWADAYAAVFQRRGLLRRKLVLLYALLETNPPSHLLFERAPRTRTRALWGLARAGTVSVARLLAGVIWFGPRHLTLGKGAERG